MAWSLSKLIDGVFVQLVFGLQSTRFQLSIKMAIYSLGLYCKITFTSISQLDELELFRNQSLQSRSPLEVECVS